MKRRVRSAVVATALLAAALMTAFFLLRKAEPAQLAERTRSTGLPLTAEQRSVEFVHADLTFVIHPDRKAIEGRSLLDFRIRQPISRIHFDLDPNLRLSQIAVNGTALEPSSWNNPKGLATVNLPRAFAAGESLRLAIDYAGRPHVAENAPWKGGFVWSRTNGGKPWVATAVQGEGCDVFWPCFDNSLVEIGSVDLHIDVPEGLVAPGNGRFMGVSGNGKGRRTWHWRAARPNNYAISLNIAPYKLLKAPFRSRFGNVVPLYFWYLPGHEKGAAKLFEEFAPTLEFFERRIGPYPFGSEKVAAVETPHLGMEHQTINAYGNGYQPTEFGFDWLLQHEFAHEWFGNQVTNADWDHMWIHEGFGSYMQPLYLQWLHGDREYDAWLLDQRRTLQNDVPLVSGKSMTEEAVYNDDTGPGHDIYYKGSVLLHTLRYLIGDQAFFDATRQLVYGTTDPRPGNFQPRYGTTRDFIDAVNAATGRDYGWFFDVYVFSAPLPELVATRDATGLSLRWKVAGDKPFPMPLQVRVDGRDIDVAMADGSGRIELPAHALYTLDPHSRVLRAAPRFKVWQEWTAEQAKARAK